MKKNRSSNIELLRVIAMLMIVSFHFVFGSAYNSANLNYNTFIVKFSGILVNSVSIFLC